MKKELTTLICPIHYLSYIFNADMDGLTDKEIEGIDAVLLGYCCFSASENVFFSYKNDFFSLGANCITLNAYK